MTISMRGASVISVGRKINRDVFVKTGVFVAEENSPKIVIDGAGLELTPGLIDLQIYGYGGEEFCNDEKSLLRAQKELPSFGITSFLPTVGSLPKEKYQFLTNFKFSQNQAGAQVLGWHLEGPFLQPLRRGIHASKNLLETIDEPFWRALFSTGLIRVMTLAPEIACGEKLFSLLDEYKIIPAIGHTTIQGKSIQKVGERWGGVFVTHLFNGMPALHHRSSSLVGEVLGNRVFSFTLIADGSHVSPETVRICYRSFREGIALISDASSFLGGEKTHGTFLGEDVIVCEKGLCSASEGKLAGSILGLDEVVRRFQEMTGCSFAFAIQAASEKPAKLLNLHHKKGKIAFGFDADCVFWEEKKGKRTVVATIGGGKILYATEEFMQQRVRGA